MLSALHKLRFTLEVTKSLKLPRIVRISIIWFWLTHWLWCALIEDTSHHFFPIFLFCYVFGAARPQLSECNFSNWKKRKKQEADSCDAQKTERFGAEDCIESHVNNAADNNPDQHIDADYRASWRHFLGSTMGTSYLDWGHKEHVELDLSIDNTLEKHNPPSFPPLF